MLKKINIGVLKPGYVGLPGGKGQVKHVEKRINYVIKLLLAVTFQGESREAQHCSKEPEFALCDVLEDLVRTAHC